MSRESGGHEATRWPLKATGELTDGGLVLLENPRLPRADRRPTRTSAKDEFFFVIDGAFEIRIGDEMHAVGPFAFVPRGTATASATRPELLRGSSARTQVAAPNYGLRLAAEES